MKGLLLFIALIASCLLVEGGNVKVAEHALNIEAPFSDFYYQWIGADVCIAMIRVNKNYTNEIWRTQDGGQSWASIQDKLAGSQTADTQPEFMYPNPVNPAQFYIRGLGRTSWITNDYGKTWEAIVPKLSDGNPQQFVNLEFHPYQKDWALGTTGPLNRQRPSSIFYTKDFGRTWSFVAEAFEFTWGDAGKGDVPHDTIYMSVQDTSGWHNFVKTKFWSH